MNNAEGIFLNDLLFDLTIPSKNNSQLNHHKKSGVSCDHRNNSSLYGAAIESIINLIGHG